MSIDGVFESGMGVSRLAHGFTIALVPRDGNPTRERGVDYNPRLRVGLPNCRQKVVDPKIHSLGSERRH